MKKWIAGLLALLCALGLTACCPIMAHPEQTVPPVTSAPEQTEPAQITEPVTEPPETAPPHSDLYIPGLAVEDVISYFNEVSLDAEFTESGDPSKLQKWNAPIYYQISGEYTLEDMTVLTNFTTWLNTVEGFPGIYEAEENGTVNMRIYFCTQDEMGNRMGDNFRNLDGGVTFWYNNDRIYDCIICYRTDLDQQVRNSVIIEEIYNGLGPIQDTDLRPDSIIYSGYSIPQSMTEIDELLLKLLYHPDMQCGLNAEECAAVIRRLYY